MAGQARMSDVAKLAGVSTMTVSRVLNENSKVTEGLRQKVYAAVEQLRYQPNELARSLREQRSRQIGIIVPYLVDPFFANCAHAISTVAKQHACSVVLSTSNEDAETKFNEANRMLRRCTWRQHGIPRATDTFSHATHRNAWQVRFLEWARVFVSSLLFIFTVLHLHAQAPAAPNAEPVNPHATPEVRALLHEMDQLSGHATLTGEHNFPDDVSR